MFLAKIFRSFLSPKKAFELSTSDIDNHFDIFGPDVLI